MLNLVAQEVLFGSKNEAFEQELQNIAYEELELIAWRKKGPISKLYNIVY